MSPVRPFFLIAFLAFSLLAAGAFAQSTQTGPLARVPGTREALPLTQAVESLAGARLVWAGESHDDPVHHALQLAVLKGLFSQGRPLAVGLEMIRRDSQPQLDAWVAGKLGEDRMRAVFADNWGMSFDLYRDIFAYCRENRIPMLGLNVPRGITRKVAREGFASLTQEELGLLPPLTCDVSPAYRDFLARLAGSGHAPGAPSPHGDRQGFERFCEAQSVWDAALAAHALEYLKAHPDARVLILCGGVHAWKLAGPARAQRLLPGVAQAVLQPEGGPGAMAGRETTADADFLLSLTP